MKKYLMTVVAALAAASFTSCSNEMDMFDPISSDKATIDLNVSNDVLMATRASSEITDYTKWIVKVSPQAFLDESNNVNVTAGETPATGWISASSSAENGISSKSFMAGGYKIEVSNYTGEAESYKANSNKGDAYYVGSVNKNLKKGSNSVTIDCDKAKNCRVNVSLSGLGDLTAITNATIILTQTNRGVDCPPLSDGETGYFKTGEDIYYQLSYKYNNVQKYSSSTVKIYEPAEHTEYSIVASTNTTGKIILTIQCDDTFDHNQADDKSIVIDAATGDEDNS